MVVFIEDSGSVFDAPIEMVWKLAEDQIEQGNKIHPNTRNNKTEIISETSFINTWEQDDANGRERYITRRTVKANSSWLFRKGV